MAMLSYFNHIYRRIARNSFTFFLLLIWQVTIHSSESKRDFPLQIHLMPYLKKSRTVKGSVSLLVKARVFCWSLLNLSEQHSCTFLIDIFPWKHALHCTNPVAKEWALVRFFSSFCGIFFSLSLALTALRTELTYNLFQRHSWRLRAVLMVSPHLCTLGDARVVGHGKLGSRARGLQKSANPPSGEENCAFFWIGWTKGDQWTKLADLGKRFILEVCLALVWENEGLCFGICVACNCSVLMRVIVDGVKMLRELFVSVCCRYYFQHCLLCAIKII